MAMTLVFSLCQLYIIDTKVKYMQFFIVNENKKNVIVMTKILVFSYCQSYMINIKVKYLLF